MISVREALQRVLRDLPRLGGETVALPRARGRVLGEEIRSPRDVPPFRNSAMDGYAVLAADLAPASAERPVRLAVLETVAAGAVPSRAVCGGSATRIMTGAPVPEGADAVVRVEDTSDADGDVLVAVSVPSGANVRNAGEDVRAGEVVLRPGRRLRPADLGVLASVGVAVVKVVRRPRVAILSTGDELVDLGQPLGPGQIVNSNAYALGAAVEDVGGEPILFGAIPDRREALRAAFVDACRADLVLSTGGVSVGNFDYVRDTLAEIGYAERFWKVAQKPGKPLSFGMRGETPVFGLPGNPVSCLVCFSLYVVPALRTMMGMEEIFLPHTTATMAETIPKARALTEFVRCSVEGPAENRLVRSTGSQSSGVLRSLSLGDGLIVGPAGESELPAGARVRVVLLRPEVGSAEPPV